ncbi:hypothetical protein [Nitrospina gracilis]|uniref:hypothetical protein n=1 Tax=Nitrospina gracilis TaxID=35801 RepID=UPI001F3DE96A|nr:hypothetical protein [Nitrospina gracilis]MCF8721536.1 Tfp pilus assembly protein PilX [Nitrospina gracilis Nb-211]
MWNRKHKLKSLDNERGIAALVMVLLGATLVAAISLSFLTQTQTKQYGASLASTGANALMTAESGLRYTEKCLLNNDPACPAVTANTDWTLLTAGFTKTFGSGNGQFDITFAPIDSMTVVVTSVGTYRGAQREVSKTIMQVPSCKLGVNVVTSCQAPNIHAQANVTGTVETGYCPSPALVDPVVFPGTPAGCPNLDYIVMLNAPVLLAPYHYCSYDHLVSYNITINSDVTIWVANNYNMRNASSLTINGNVTINVGGNWSMMDDSEIIVNGTLTIQTAGLFEMRNNAVINVNGGDAADALLLAEGNVTLTDDALFVGGLISNGKVILDKRSILTGAILADDVDVKKNTTATWAATAGMNSPQYNQCSP